MLSCDDRPAPPAIPRFSRDMRSALEAAARDGSPGRQAPARAAGLGKRAAVGLAVAAVAVAAGVGIDQAVGHGPSTTSARSTGHVVHIRTAAFMVDTNAGGTVTVTLLHDHAFVDPGALRNALAEAGVPALVTAGKVCYLPHHPTAVLPMVLSGTPHQANGNTVVTITPAAIPAGSELSIGYFQVSGGHGLFVTVVPDNASLTCAATPPYAPAPRH
jgi:hypothetical protein